MKYAIRLLLMMSLLSSAMFAQGVTNGAITGQVSDKDGNGLPGVNVMAVHVPSGTKYGVTTREDGHYNLPNLRVGGPYTVSSSMLGYSKQERPNVFVQLAQTTTQDFRLASEDVQMGAVEVTAERSTVLNAGRTGAATSVSAVQIQSLPTITRKVQDFSRLTPQFSGNNSFGGMDNRYNNTTVDGSYFNNSFGLQGQPGDRTNVAPVSVDAVEQIQVNIAPYDVRQGNFIGAGVNTITKSGTNEISGNAYYYMRHQGLVGQQAGDVEYKPGRFQYYQLGANIGGPIIENKLFLFGSFETENLTQPGTTFRANKGGETVGGNTTRVLASDLDALSSFLKTNFGYVTGPYQGYENETPAMRLLAKMDYNLDDNNKLILRYIHLDSKTDVLVSNSSSLGLGTGGRQNTTTALGFQNSNYQIGENIRNVIGEWNSTFGDNMANNLIVGYSHHDESRESRGEFFPFVDILNAGTNYTSFGYEPFTPNNELRYSSIQLQDNFTYYMGDHYLTLGASIEKYQSENIFFPGAQSAYVYNKLSDFYTDANGYLANPARTTSDSTLRRFQVRWANIPGLKKPVQELKVLYTGFYAQDEWQAMKDLRLSFGLRVDIPFFENTGYRNTEVDTMKFRDENGAVARYATDKMPNANILWSPRFGFNYDLSGDRTTQIRGGSGIFTGKPAYVWISNQIGNNGVLTGFEQTDNTKNRPFNPNPDRYKPTSVTGAPAASYELALTDPDFKFPQLWRSNIAVDQKLPFDLVGTAEFLYSTDVNGVYYINANLPKADTMYVGVDSRPRWKTTNRINGKVPNAIVMKNEDVGYSWNLAFSLEKPFSEGWFAKAAYSYGVSKNTVDPGSIASGSWFGNAMSQDPNNPGVGFAGTSPGHRVFGTASYRLEYFDMGATTMSVFWEGRTIGTSSYTFSGDLNNDGGVNDLIYIPKDQSEMNFAAIGGTTPFTVQQQKDAWETYIKQDEYLNANRGKYAERNAVFMPMVFRADFSLTQEVFTELFGKRNSLQFRMDVLNFTNLLSSDWGLSQRFVTTQPLINVTPVDGRVLYQLRAVNGKLIDHTFEKTASIDDVYRIQFGVRYTFN